MDKSDKDKLTDLCAHLGLGEIIREPEYLLGGLLHRMAKVSTTEGFFAIKMLNPKIMLREKAMKDLIQGEMVAVIAKGSIGAVSARRFHGNVVHEFDGDFFIVFDFMPGRSLKQEEITKAHCEKIGEALAKLHSINFGDRAAMDWEVGEAHRIDWEAYLRNGKERGANWAGVLEENLQNLHAWTEKVMQAEEKLKKTLVISHRDMDSKNVMWNGEDPVVIDWESSGPINPAADLLETALYWAKDAHGNIDYVLLEAFLHSYAQIRPIERNDLWISLDRGYSPIGWLEYSLKRSLGIECASEAEQKMGTEHVTATIAELLKYQESRPSLEAFFREAIGEGP